MWAFMKVVLRFLIGLVFRRVHGSSTTLWESCDVGDRAAEPQPATFFSRASTALAGPVKVMNPTRNPRRSLLWWRRRAAGTKFRWQPANFAKMDSLYTLAS